MARETLESLLGKYIRDLANFLKFLLKRVPVQHSVICIDITVKVVLNTYLSLLGS